MFWSWCCYLMWTSSQRTEHHLQMHCVLADTWEKAEKVRAIWRKLVFIQIAEREVFSHWQKPLTLWKKQSTWISCHPDGDLKNIALRAGLASPNQLRHGSAQASLALLIWLKRWIGKDELLNIFNRRFIDEDSLIACNDCLYLLLRELSACKISYRS